MNQQTNNSDLMVSGPALPDSAIDTLSDKAPEKKKKKMGVGGKILLVIVCILLVILLALGAFVYCALKDDMPQASDEYKEIELSSFIADAAKEILSEKTITLESKHLDYILAPIKDNVNSSDNTYSVRDLFMVIADGKATIYGRIDVDVMGMTITLPAQIDVGISYENDKIRIDIQKVTCGTISAPDAVVTYAISAVSGRLPENFSAENNAIYYDVSSLDEMIDQEIANQMSSSDSWLSELLTSAVQDIVNVDLTGARIEDDKLIIEGSIL